MTYFRIAIFALLLANINCSARHNQLIRRLKRQSSRDGPRSLAPPKIQYASISAGTVPERVKSRLRSGSLSPSVSSSSPTNGAGSNQLSGGGASSGAATGYPQTGGQYGMGVQQYPYGGGGGGYSNSNMGNGYRPLAPYGQQAAGSSSSQDAGQSAVPLGHSIYPYANIREAQQGYQQEYQKPNRYSTQYSSMPQYGSTGRGGYQQQPMGYQPMGGYNPYGGMSGYGGYGGGYQMGRSPYATGGGYGGGMSQMPYMNPYSMPQRGHYGAGYQSRGYSDASSIGSAYRDPSSQYSSYVHPNPQIAGSTGGYGGNPYGQGRSSYYGGSGSSSSYGRSNPYGSASTQRGGSGSNYYGAGSSTGADGYGSSSYGQSQTPSGSSYGQPYGGGYGNTGSTADTTYGSQGGSTPNYGGSVGQSDPYSQSSGSAYGGGSSQSSENPYGQTSGSRYETSGSRYGYDESQYGAGGGYGSYGQTGNSQDKGTAEGNSQAGGGTAGGGYYNPYPAQGSLPEQPSASSQSSASYPQQGSQYGSQTSSRSQSGASGRFRNPEQSQIRGRTQQSPLQQNYQTGRFYNSENGDSNPQVGVQPRVGGTSDSEGISATPSLAAEEPSSPLPADQPVGPRAIYPEQLGVFLVSSRERERITDERQQENEKEETRQKQGVNSSRRKNKHPSLKKCNVLEDGLPDIYVDAGKLGNSVFLDRKSLRELKCAKEENCLAKSAYSRYAIPVRRLLRFATIVHNRGSAAFRPHTHHSNWKFHQCHDHYHSMKEFAHFHLLFENGTTAAEGHKVSFCLEDTGCKNPCKGTFTCNETTQGISPGCHDDYLASRDCQWIDVTDVIPDKYTLRITVNPIVNGTRAVPELSYTNNVVECKVEIAMNRAETIGQCKIKR